MVLTWKHTISVCCIIVNRFLWKRTYSTLVKIYIRLNENSFENEASSIHRLQYSMLHGLFPCDNMLGYLVYYWSSNRISFQAMLKQNIQIWMINNAESEVGVAVIPAEWWHNIIYNKFTPPIPVLGLFHSIHHFLSGYLSWIKQLFFIPCSKPISKPGQYIIQN